MDSDKQKPIAIVGMSFRFPGEADGMDPQHRHLLEVTYEAFENVNQSTGCGNSMLSNRLSWFFDLRGPSFSIDTACSSSMVALHEACRDILDGTTSMGVVAGSSLMLVPNLWRALSSQRFLSPDGACHSFDSQANGYGRGEGFGVIILKPLEDAIRDNDVIRAVIRGSGINQDGKTPAITVPNAHAQMSLIRSTYEKAGLEMSKTAYFEAHGTGTPVGDPLELLAIGQTIGAARAQHGTQPFIVGSVKSNIGHLGGASGIAGVIKTVLLLEQGQIPAVAEFQNLNPRIKDAEWNIKIPTELTPWPDHGLRRASVNSFGYGGSNGHVILDDAFHYLRDRGLTGHHNTVETSIRRPSLASSQSTDSAVFLASARASPALAPSSAGPKLYVFSSPGQEGLERLAESYSQYLGQDFLSRKLEGDEESDLLRNLSYTLASRRTTFDWRTFVVADSHAGLKTALGEGLPKHSRIGKRPTCAFVFTGQGAQWHAMGQELLCHAIFGATIADADAYMGSLDSQCSRSLKEELNRDKGASRINEPQISQPACTAIQIALVDLLRHWGVQPKSVVGHSSGEIAAAYAGGLLSREDAWKVAYWRGVRSAQVNSLLSGRRGQMLAAAMSEEAAQGYVNKIDKGDVTVACINSPNSVTISGDDFAVAEVEKQLAADGIWCRKLRVTTAYHSTHMKAIAALYEQDVQDISPLPEDAASETSPIIFSSVTETEVTSREAMGTAAYWVSNMLNPVRFSDAVVSLLAPRDARSRRRGIVANVDALIEIGPHSALQGPLMDILAAMSVASAGNVPSYIAILQRDVNAFHTALTAAGKLWSMGFGVNLSLVNSMGREPPKGRPLASLPSYPFNHKKRYWSEPRSSRWGRSLSKARSDLLGQQSADYSTGTPTWRNFLSPSELPWLLDYKVHGLLIMPGAVYIAMVLEACQDTSDPTRTLEGYEFRDIVWHKPILGTKTVSSTVTWTRFSITTIDAGNGQSTEHCSGLVQVKYPMPPGEIDKGSNAVAEWDRQKSIYEAFKARSTISIDARGMYDRLDRIGLQFGPTFRNLFNIQSGAGFMYVDIETPNTASTMPENLESALPLHATVLDATFQMLAATEKVMDMSSFRPTVMLPESISSLYISAAAPTEPGTILEGYCTRVDESSAKASKSCVLSDRTWEKRIVVLKNLVVNAAPGAQGGSNSSATASHARLEWIPDVRRSSFSRQSSLLLNQDLGSATADSIVVELLDHSSYVNPNLEILEMANGTITTCAAEVLSRLGVKTGTGRLGGYTWTSRDEESVPAAATELSFDSNRLGEYLHVKTLDSGRETQAQGFVEGTFDYVIWSRAAHDVSDLDGALRNIKLLLKADGKVILKASTNSQRDGLSDEKPNGPNGWGELLKRNGFTGVDQVFKEFSGDSIIDQVSVVTSTAAREIAYQCQDVLLITPTNLSEKTAELVKNCFAKLTSLGLTVNTIPWTEVEGVVAQRLIISLVQLEGDVFFNLSEALFHATKIMSLESAGMLWVTQAGVVAGTVNPGHSISSGLFRAIRSEDETRSVATLDLSIDINLAARETAERLVTLFSSLFGQEDIRGPDKEFAQDGRGAIFVQRLVEDAAITASAKATMAATTTLPPSERLFQRDRKLAMTIGQIGALDTLQLGDSVKVMYTGLNFLDVMASLGEVPSAHLGRGVVGVVTEVGSSVTNVKPGKTVVATSTGSFGSHARMKHTVCHHIPPHISAEEAVSIPTAFATAWIGLVDLAQIRKGESILIHSAAGGVGQAATRICQYFGLEIFATVGSTPKKELLMNRYKISEHHIFDSRNTSFAQGVKRITKGRGVDLVLNSVAGEFLRQSWHLVAPFARFVELRKRDILGNTGLDMAPFLRSASFIGFNLQQYTEGSAEYEVFEKALQHIFELVASGKLQPIAPINLYNYCDAPDAFRALQSGKIKGKVVLHARDDEMVPVVPRADQPMTLDPDSTYLLAGGLGGIGRSIALMLYSHGARNLAFLSKSGGAKEASQAALQQLQRLGCTARAYACDISEREQLSHVVKEYQSEMPAIKGVIQCAMTLRDGIFENMTYDDWVSCTRPKIQGSWNLHDVLPKDLDFFVMLSSTSGIIGNPGQANYAAGNTFEDALAHYRRRHGLKAVALDIGAVRDVGYLAESQDPNLNGLSHLQQFLTICEADVHFLVKTAIKGYTVDGQKIGPQIVSGLAGADIDEQFFDRSPWARDGKLCIALKTSLINKTAAAGMQAGLDALDKAFTAEEATIIVEEMLSHRVAASVMIPDEDLSRRASLQAFGVNSLVAVELKTWVSKELQTEVSVADISPSSISSLATTIVTNSKLFRGRNFKKKRTINDGKLGETDKGEEKEDQ
ncbi:lovastatin diketide synthase [Rhypophila decipiens]